MTSSTCEPNMTFTWTTERWATKRTNNVEKLYEQWAKDPSRVEVLVDSKLKEDHLVILKKAHLNELIRKCEASSNSSTKVQIESLIRAVDLLVDLNNKETEHQTLKQAVSLLSTIRKSLQFH